MSEHTSVPISADELERLEVDDESVLFVLRSITSDVPPLPPC